MTVTLATFMEVLDSSIANVSLPHIAGSLGATYEEAIWILTSYLVSSAIVLPVSGWLSTIIGRKRFYMSCVALFTICSFFCGIAPTLPLLIIARVLQGAGGGGLQPSEQAILADTFPPEKRGMAFRHVWHGRGGCTRHRPHAWRLDYGQFQLALDLFHQSSHRAAFAVSHAPVSGRSALAEGGTSRWHQNRLHRPGSDRYWRRVFPDRARQGPGDYDWFGSPLITAMSCIGIPTLAAFFLWEWYHEQPIVDVRLLEKPQFRNSRVLFIHSWNGAVRFNGIDSRISADRISGTPPNGPVMALSGGGLVLMLMMPVAGRLTGQQGRPRLLISIGFLGTAVTLHLMTVIYLQHRLPHHSNAAHAAGHFPSAHFHSHHTLNYVGVPREKNNQVSGLSNFARNIGGSIGTSLLSTFLTRQNQTHLRIFAAHTSQANGNFQQFLHGLESLFLAQGYDTVTAARKALALAYQSVQQQASALSFVNSFWVMSVVIACLTPLPFIMRRPRPGEQQPRAAH